MDISDDLLRRAKRRAADDGIALREVFETALRRYLTGRDASGPYKLRWTPDHGRVQPGVNLDDRDALFDLMDGRR